MELILIEDAKWTEIWRVGKEESRRCFLRAGRRFRIIAEDKNVSRFKSCIMRKNFLNCAFDSLVVCVERKGNGVFFKLKKALLQ